MVRSNVEAGEGFADIIVEPEDPDAGIILELKYSKEAAGLEKACQKAIHKMKEAWKIIPAICTPILQKAFSKHALKWKEEYSYEICGKWFSKNCKEGK